jgi:hypothetical protein
MIREKLRREAKRWLMLAYSRHVLNRRFTQMIYDFLDLREI